MRQGVVRTAIAHADRCGVASCVEDAHREGRVTCDGGRLQVAHTTPVYVTVNGGGFENPETARRDAEISEGYLKELEAELANPPSNLDEQAPRHRAQLERQIAEARGAAQAGALVAPTILSSVPFEISAAGPARCRETGIRTSVRPVLRLLGEL